MPYRRILNPDNFTLMWASDFYSLRSIMELKRELNRCDFSVVASRRETHVALNNFLASGVSGSILFDEDTRFPEGVLQNYVCSAEGLFDNWAGSMSSILSYRSTAVSKDIESTGNGGNHERFAMVKEQGDQDAFKQFTELKKVLGVLASSSVVRWNQQNFERKIAGTWEGNPPRANI